MSKEEEVFRQGYFNTLMIITWVMRTLTTVGVILAVYGLFTGYGIVNMIEMLLNPVLVFYVLSIVTNTLASIWLIVSKQYSEE